MDTALTNTARQSDALSSKAQQAGNNLSAAFAATGGGLSVSRGLVGISTGLRNADGAMAAFAASQTLLDMGRFSADLRAVGAATGVAGGAFAKFGAIIKANPILFIAGALASAASVMGLFGKETAATAKAFEKLAEAQEKARLSEKTRAFLGLSTLQPRQQKLQGAEDLVEDLFKDPSRRSLGDLSKSSGFSLDSIQAERDSLFGGSPAPTRQVARNISSVKRGGSERIFVEEAIPVAEQQINAATAKLIIRKLYDGLRESVEAQAVTEKFSDSGKSVDIGGTFNRPTQSSGSFFRGDPVPGFLQRVENDRISEFKLNQSRNNAFQFGQGVSDFPVNFGGPSTAGDLIRQTPGERSQIDQDIADRDADIVARNADESKRAMDELIAQGERFGATLGDAFFNVATGAITARQAIAQIVADLARATSQQAFAKLFGIVSSGVSAGFGASAAQTTANNTPGVDAPGNGSNIKLGGG